jgi:hypothetical protein
MSEIIEHYHLTICDSDGQIELTIYNHDGLYTIRDDDGDFDQPHHIVGHSASLVLAVSIAAEFLRQRKPNGYFVRGAGAPPDKILHEAKLI